MADRPAPQRTGTLLDSGYFDGPMFTDLLGVISRKRVTGKLQLARERATRQLHFVKGVPLEKEAASIVKEVCAWPGGSFRLIQEPVAGQPAAAPSMLALIHEGSAAFSAEILGRLAFRLDGVVLAAPAGQRLPPDVTLVPAELKLLAAIDGRKTVGELLRASGAASVRLLYALHSTEQALTHAPPATVTTPGGRHRIQPEAATRVDPGRLLAAEGAFHRAKKLLARKDFKAAHARLVEATQLDPDEGDYLAYLGWTEFQMNPQDPLVADRALQALEKALQMHPANEKSYLFRGRIHEARGERAQAQTDYERALQCNADSHEALRALRRMNSRVA